MFPSGAVPLSRLANPLLPNDPPHIYPDKEPLIMYDSHRGKTRLAKWYAPYSVSFALCNSSKQAFKMIFQTRMKRRLNLKARSVLPNPPLPPQSLTHRLPLWPFFIFNLSSLFILSSIAHLHSHTGPPPNRAPRPKASVQLRRVPRLEDRLQALRRLVLLRVCRRER